MPLDENISGAFKSVDSNMSALKLTITYYVYIKPVQSNSFV